MRPHLHFHPASLMARPHLPRRSVRLRLTVLYGALFLASGAGLLAIAITNVLAHGWPPQGGSAIGVPRGTPPPASTNCRSRQRPRRPTSTRRQWTSCSLGRRSRWASWPCCRSRWAGSSPAGCSAHYAG